MDGRVPTIESAWAWLIDFVPPELRPWLGLAVTIAIISWFVLKGLQAVFDFFKSVVLFLRSLSEKKSASEDVRLPPPRVSIWNADINSPPRPKSLAQGGIPIITTANMKGGVGKTTFTANFAAFLDSKKQKRVLLIDLDYQGSLSQTMTAAANSENLGSAVDDLVTGRRPISQILESAQPLAPALKRSKILTCYYEFADTETHELVDWVVALRSGQEASDIRFRLADLLRDEVVQNEFDCVLIDAPPRFSTGTINALCASTHLIIPTKLDRMSVEAVIFFSRDVDRMRSKLFPGLKLVGVVPTMTKIGTRLLPDEAGHVTTLNRDLAQYWGRRNNSVISGAFIPDTKSISFISGSGVAYFDAGERAKTRKARDIFDRVGALVFEQIK
jgi:cellulose biosynthesis protein BcsQ